MVSPSPRAAARNQLADRIELYGKRVRSYTEALLPARPGLEQFYGMLAYHLGWVDTDFQPRDTRPGKSLRPGLCMLLGESLGADIDALIPVAAGIELLHNFSLIHDDIQDRSATRRGRPAVWMVWGVAQAINAGDAMFSLAHTAWLQSGLLHSDSSAYAEIVASLEGTVLRLCEGQFLDMHGERRLDTTSQQYLAMIGGKTAALIGESAWTGARAATDAADILRAARGFGEELGLAFQIRDDILGIWGNESDTGKSAATDIESRKMTLPVVLAMEKGDPSVVQTICQLYGDQGSAHTSDDIRALLERAGGKEFAFSEEEKHWHAAMRALDAIPIEAHWREQLEEFARSFVGRLA